MILVDPRAGSGPLLRPLRAMSLPAKHRRLKYGDLAFHGNGSEGRILIGIEYKKLSDYLTCIVDKRLASHQIPGMVRKYHREGRWLIVEGVVRPRKDSMLEEFSLFRSRRGSELGAFNMVRAGITYSQMRRYEITIRKRAGFEVVFTSGLADTLGTLAAIYHWYQKPWSAHHAHLALPALQDNHPRRIEVLFRRPSVLRRIASCLPGVGWVRSEAVASAFRSVCRMADATLDDWKAIPGIGPKTAAAVHRAMRQSHKERI